jgi:inner membrane protein
VYRAGHYGVALLVYAPVGFALLLSGRPTLAVAGGAVVLALTPLPDYDQRVPVVSHRGSTHTVAFALLVGGVLSGVASAGGLAVPLVGFAFFAGALSVAAHLLADWLTPAGVRPFWPLTDREFSLSMTTAANPLANYLLLALGVLVTVAGLFALGRLP